MGSTKKEVLIAIARVLLGAVVAYIMWSMLSTSKFFLVEDPWYMQYVPVTASILSGAVVAYLVSREKVSSEG